MSVIEDRDKALRFARAILADLSLYNQDKLASASDPERDLASELAEGRALFRTRVSPALHACFDEEVTPWAAHAARDAPKGPVANPEEAERLRAWRVAAHDEEQRGEEERDASTAERGRTQRALIGTAVLVVVIAAGTAYALSARQHSAELQRDKQEGSHH
jgi:hypothetical protein